MLMQGKHYEGYSDSLGIYDGSKRKNQEQANQQNSAQTAAAANNNTKPEEEKNQVTSDLPEDPKVGNRSTE